MVITLIVSWALAFFYTRPVRRLDEAMERFALGEFDVRVEKSIGPAGGEIAALARVFDRMANRIQSSYCGNGGSSMTLATKFAVPSHALT